MAQDAKSIKYTRYTFINNLIWYSLGIFDYLNTSAIYSGYVTQALMQVFQQTLKFVFFPIYAINTAVYAVLGLINLLYDRDKETKKIKKENIIRFVVNITSALIVCTAVIGSLAFAATMGIATTILFALNLTVTGIYNFVGGGYHLFQFIKKGRMLKDQTLTHEMRERIVTERIAHKGSMFGYFAVGTTIALIALAGGLAILGGFLPLAALGIAGGVIGVGFCILAIVNEVKRHKQENKKSINPPKIPPSNTSTINVIRKLCNNLTTKLSNMGKAFRHKETESAPLRKNPQQSESHIALLATNTSSITNKKRR